jgi:hypothetical protein
MSEIEAGERLAMAFSRKRPLTAAFWLKVSGDEERYLYLASDLVDDANIDMAYEEVLQIAYEMDHPELWNVKLIGSSSPLAMAALDLNRRFPGRKPHRFGSTLFGGIVADEVYLYPQPLSALAS